QPFVGQRNRPPLRHGAAGCRGRDPSRNQGMGGWHIACGTRRVAAASPCVAAAEYVPHRPHETVLYGILREHLATFLAHTESMYAAPLPKYVVETFEHYLAWGTSRAGFCAAIAGDVAMMCWSHSPARPGGFAQAAARAGCATRRRNSSIASCPTCRSDS